jgi:hypothetical protein
MTNTEIVHSILNSLPLDFYGHIELAFHKGSIMQAKTITSKKFNPEQKTAENELAKKSTK